MGRFVKGQVVVVPFPFSDLTDTKRRPALVVASLQGDDVILCQITSKVRGDSYGVQLNSNDFLSGGLNHPSVIKPNHLFTSASQLIIREAGQITETKMQEVVTKLIEIIKAK
jgi:mRNA interferase MazF